MDGWGLAHALLADACDDVLGSARNEASSAAAAERDAWTLVAQLASNPARDNALGARALWQCRGAPAVGQSGDAAFRRCSPATPRATTPWVSARSERKGALCCVAGW